MIDENGFKVRVVERGGGLYAHSCKDQMWTLNLIAWTVSVRCALLEQKVCVEWRVLVIEFGVSRVVSKGSMLQWMVRLVKLPRSDVSNTLLQ